MLTCWAHSDPLPPAKLSPRWRVCSLPTHLFISAQVKLWQGPSPSTLLHLIPLQEEWQSSMKSFICQDNSLQRCVKRQPAFWYSGERVIFRINMQLTYQYWLRVLLFPWSQEGVTDRGLGQHSEDIVILHHSGSSFELLPVSPRPGQRDGPVLLQCSTWTFSQNFIFKGWQLQLTTLVQRKRCIYLALTVLIT